MTKGTNRQNDPAEVAADETGAETPAAGAPNVNVTNAPTVNVDQGAEDTEDTEEMAPVQDAGGQDPDAAEDPRRPEDYQVGAQEAGPPDGS